MAKGVDWIVKLTDKFSPTANKVLGSLDSIINKSKGLEEKAGKAIGRFLGGLASKAGIDVQKFANVVSAVGPVAISAAGKAASGIKKGLGGAVSSMSSLAKGLSIGVILAAAASATAIAGLAIKLGVAATHLAYDSHLFGTAARASFAALTGSVAAGDTLYKKVLDMAAHFRVAPDSLVESTNRLISAGFDGADALKILQAALDIKALDPKKDITQLTEAFAKIRTKGVVKELEQLSEASGIESEKIAEQLAKLNKIDISKAGWKEQLKALLESGKVSAGEGISAVMAAIQAKAGTGRIGEQADKSRNSVANLIEGFKNLPRNFMLRMMTDDGPVRKLLTLVLDNLDPNSANGKKILGFLQKLADDFVSVFEGVDADDVLKTLKDLGTTAKSVVTTVIELGKAFAEGAGKEMKVLKPTLEGILNLFGKGSMQGKGFADTMRTLGSAAVTVAAAIGLITLAIVEWFAAVVNDVKSFTTKIETALESVTGFFEDFANMDVLEEIKNIGTDIIDGIVNGLSAGAKKLKTTWNSVVDILPNTVSDKLKIQSPSRVMMEMGENTTAGFSQGLEDGEGDIQSAANSAFSIPGAGAGGTGGPSVSSSNDIQVNVYYTAPAGGNPQADGENIAAIIRRELKLALEGGELTT